MYTPKHFSVQERSELLAFVERHAFGALISCTDGEFQATHIPFVVCSREPLVLGGHVALANPQWRSLDGARVLVIFQGAHAMISASWYADAAHSVPTWNYRAVHCDGRARVLDRAGTRRILERLVREHEPEWSIESADASYVERLEAGITGIEIDVESMNGAFKLSQNRSQEDRERVIAQLAQSDDAQASEVADAMRSLKVQSAAKR